MKHYAVTTNNDVSGVGWGEGLGASNAVTFRSKQLSILALLRFYAA